MKRLGLLVACLLLVAISNPGICTAQQEVAAAPTGLRAFDYVGRVIQQGDDFHTFGYLTYIRGLDDALLFSDPEHRNEKTARFTFYSKTKLTSRAVVGNLFNVNLSGGLIVYVREPQPQATFEGAEAYKHFQATPIAFNEVHGQSIITITTPNGGINTAHLEGKQLQTPAFSIGGKTYRFGRADNYFKYSHTGAGKRTKPEPIEAEIWIAGQAVSHGRAK